MQNKLSQFEYSLLETKWKKGNDMKLQEVYFWLLLMIVTTVYSYLYLSPLFTVSFLITGLIMASLVYMAVEIKEEEWDEKQQ